MLPSFVPPTVPRSSPRVVQGVASRAATPRPKSSSSPGKSASSPATPRRARFASDRVTQKSPLVDDLTKRLERVKVREVEGAAEGGGVLLEILDSDEDESQGEVVDLISASEGEKEDDQNFERRRVPGSVTVFGESERETGSRTPPKARKCASATPRSRAKTRVRSKCPPPCSLRGSQEWLIPAWEVDVVEDDAASGRVRARPYSFAAVRGPAAVRLMRFFDREVVDGDLEGRISVSWSARLLRTAGVTYMVKVNGERRARIELSVKVVDDLDRLYQTLAHEVCHAAAWVVDNVARPPHGAVFKEWVGRFENWDRTMSISTCHEYEVQCKFVYTCGDCGYGYGRHSKSINIGRQVCGKCKGGLVLHVKKASDLRAEVSARLAAR